MFQRLFGRERRANQAIVEALYAQSWRPRGNLRFYSAWGVPDTPLGRFEMLSLHIFLFQHRLRGETGVLTRDRAGGDRRVFPGGRSFAAGTRHRRCRRAQTDEEAGPDVLRPYRRLWRSARCGDVDALAAALRAKRPARQRGMAVGRRACRLRRVVPCSACCTIPRRHRGGQPFFRVVHGSAWRSYRPQPDFLSSQRGSPAPKGHAANPCRDRGTAQVWPRAHELLAVDRLGRSCWSLRGSATAYASPARSKPISCRHASSPWSL